MVSLLLFIGLSAGYHLASGSVLSVMVRPGDDIVIYCDCGISPGVLVVWYRNCSHRDQPTLVLKLRTKYLHHLRNDPVSWMAPLPRFQFVRNHSSNSYDLQITNVTESDEGFYFCGTQTSKVEDEEGNDLKKRYQYVYGNAATQIILNTSKEVESHGTASWVALVSAAALFLCNVCFILLYHFCQENDSRVHMRANQMDDCFSTTVVFGTREGKTQKTL